MKKSREFIFLLVIIVLIVGGYYLWVVENRKFNTTLEPTSEIKNDTEKNTSGGVYENEKYNFRFSYPEGWHISTDNLGEGTLQLFNYQESKESGSIFSKGMNKIEATIVAGNPYKPSSDYPEKMHNATEVNITGEKASRVEIEFVGEEKILGYLIPLINTEGKFIAITIYGDPSNFGVLENLIKSFEWTP